MGQLHGRHLSHGEYGGEEAGVGADVDPDKTCGSAVDEAEDVGSLT